MLASLENFGIKVVTVGNCLGWVEEFASAHCFKLLNGP